MKRILILIICLALFCMVPASPAEDLTLPVKLQRQMQHEGNGLKGSIRISANADLSQHPFLYSIQNAEYNLLRNMSGGQWHMVLFQNDEQEQQINRIELYQAEDGLYFRSDFLPERVIRLPETGEIVASAAGESVSSGDNPSILDVLSSIVSMKEADRKRWLPVIEEYAKKLEVWMADYATEPELLRNPDGTVQMNLIYVVPEDEIRSEIVNLITEAASDPEVTGLMNTILTDEQKNIYLNSGYAAYYADALKGIALNSEMRFIKTVSALGEMIASEIVLPLDPTITGYQALTIMNRQGQTGFELKGEKGVFLIELPAETDIMAQKSFDAVVRIVKSSSEEEEKKNNFALKIDIRKEYSAYTDDETGKGHEVHHFTIDVNRDTENLPDGVTETDIPEFDPVRIEAELHFSGKSGPNSPTTLETDVSVNQNGFVLQLNGKFKTAATWPFVPFSKENAVMLTGMNENDMTAAMLEWMTNATERIIRTTTEGGTGE